MTEELQALEQSINAVRVGSQLPENQRVLCRNLAYWCLRAALRAMEETSE